MDDKTLINLIINDPDRGISEAIKIYGKAVNTIVRSILKTSDQEMIDETVSETFVKMWKNLSYFHEEKGHSLKSYLYAIARNTAFDLLRKQEPTVSLEDLHEKNELSSEQTVENYIDKKYLSQLLHQLINHLGSPDDRVFLYKYFLDMKNTEIAEKLKLSNKQVENILYRGKFKLRKMLEERGIHSYDSL